MNHRWENNVCIKCGLHRKRKTQSLLMAITNFPPYNHYKHEWLWWYYIRNKEIGFLRPDCKNIQFINSIEATAAQSDNPSNTVSVQK